MGAFRWFKYPDDAGTEHYGYPGRSLGRVAKVHGVTQGGLVNPWRACLCDINHPWKYRVEDFETETAAKAAVMKHIKEQS